MRNCGKSGLRKGSSVARATEHTPLQGRLQVWNRTPCNRAGSHAHAPAKLGIFARAIMEIEPEAVKMTMNDTRKRSDTRACARRPSSKSDREEMLAGCSGMLRRQDSGMLSGYIRTVWRPILSRSETLRVMGPKAGSPRECPFLCETFKRGPAYVRDARAEMALMIRVETQSNTKKRHQKGVFQWN